MYSQLLTTKYLGKGVHFFDECGSTNSEVSMLIKNQSINHGDIVITNHQIYGRGQAGNGWQSENGSNLTFSIYLKNPSIKIEEQFNLNMVVCNAVHQFYKYYLDDSLKIKWPNDVYYGSKKLAGILIENSIRNHTLEHVIIGLGLNINQAHFSISQATSLQMITNRIIDLASALENICVSLESFLDLLQLRQITKIKEYYYQSMMGLNEIRNFDDGELFEGLIRGVDEVGRLIIEKEGVMQKYSFKEVKYLFPDIL